MPDSLSHFDLPLAAFSEIFAAVGVFVHFRRFCFFPPREGDGFFVLTKIVLDARDDDGDIKDQELEVMAAMMVIVMVIWRAVMF